VEPLIHFVVPIVALMFVGLEFRKALPISLLALLPDLDALFLVHEDPPRKPMTLVMGGIGAPNN